MKEVMEPAYRFLPVHHISQVRELLELPSPVLQCLTPLTAAAPVAVLEEVTTCAPSGALTSPRGMSRPLRALLTRCWVVQYTILV